MKTNSTRRGGRMPSSSSSFSSFVLVLDSLWTATDRGRGRGRRTSTSCPARFNLQMRGQQTVEAPRPAKTFLKFLCATRPDLAHD